MVMYDAVLAMPKSSDAQKTLCNLDESMRGSRVRAIGELNSFAQGEVGMAVT